MRFAGTVRLLSDLELEKGLKVQGPRLPKNPGFDSSGAFLIIGRIIFSDEETDFPNNIANASLVEFPGSSGIDNPMNTGNPPTSLFSDGTSYQRPVSKSITLIPR